MVGLCEKDGTEAIATSKAGHLDAARLLVDRFGAEPKHEDGCVETLTERKTDR